MNKGDENIIQQKKTQKKCIEKKKEKNNQALNNEVKNKYFFVNTCIQCAKNVKNFLISV